MAEAGRIAVVTGATRGLGRALALALARRGCRIAGCGRDPEALASLRAELPPPHRCDRVDLRDPAAVAAWARAVTAGLGAPDLLVNNAAVILPPRPLWEIAPADFADLMAVNVGGVQAVIHAFLPAMLAQGRGVVVNFSSGWGRSTSPGVAPYCASKYAIEGLTSALAQELPPGLAAVSFSPGMIDTDMLRAAFGAEAARHEKPQAWAERAAPFLLALGPRDNGRALTLPPP